MNSTMKNTIEKREWMFGIMILIALVLASSTSAMPVPHGIDGIVFDEITLEEITVPVHFSITDLVSGEYVEGMTGYGSPGRYSATLNGDDGNALLVRVWTSHNSAERNMTLQGVLHDVNFILDMTIPPEPVTSGGAGSGRKKTTSSSYTVISDRASREQDIEGGAVSSRVNEPTVISGIISPAGSGTGSGSGSGSGPAGSFMAMLENINTGEIINAELDSEHPPGGHSLVVQDSKGDKGQNEYVLTVGDESMPLLIIGNVINVKSLLQEPKIIIFVNKWLLIVLAAVSLLLVVLYRIKLISLRKKKGGES